MNWTVIVNMTEQKRQCNCKGAKKLAQVSEYLKKYGEYSDSEPTISNNFKRWLIWLIVIISVPFLFMYILLNAVYNLINGGTAKVSINKIYKYIQDSQNG